MTRVILLLCLALVAAASLVLSTTAPIINERDIETSVELLKQLLLLQHQKDIDWRPGRFG